MLPWLLVLLVLVVSAGCFCAMGIALGILVKLFVALIAIFGAAVLIARPFLRNKVGR